MVDQALPEIEEIANEHLSRLTDGRMQVTLQTRREGRTTSGYVSTLDVVIRGSVGAGRTSCSRGARSFGLTLPCDRRCPSLRPAGPNAPLQMLAVDEGFGSQGPRGLRPPDRGDPQRAGRLKKVLVITHLEDMKDAFPVRIEVSKDPRAPPSRSLDPCPTPDFFLELATDVPRKQRERSSFDDRSRCNLGCSPSGLMRRSFC